MTEVVPFQNFDEHLRGGLHSIRRLTGLLNNYQQRIFRFLFGLARI
jgi:hypothetical protein